MLRAYLMGYMTCFSFAGGGLVLLMLQYVSGGKWGLLLRRPLEAMTRTLWLVALMFLPIAVLHEAPVSVGGVSQLADATAQALANHWITLEQALTANCQAFDAEPGQRAWCRPCSSLAFC